MEIKIERGVALPENINAKYPIRDMLVGDSVVIPLDKRPSFYGCIRSFNASHGEKRTFTSKAIDVDSVRIWRVS